MPRMPVMTGTLPSRTRSTGGVAKCGTNSVVLRLSEAVDPIIDQITFRETSVCRVEGVFDDITGHWRRSRAGKRRMLTSKSEIQIIVNRPEWCI